MNHHIRSCLGALCSKNRDLNRILSTIEPIVEKHPVSELWYFIDYTPSEEPHPGRRGPLEREHHPTAAADRAPVSASERFGSQRLQAQGLFWVTK